jgi:hypothetical protein
MMKPGVQGVRQNYKKLSGSPPGKAGQGSGATCIMLQIVRPCLYVKVTEGGYTREDASGGWVSE